MIVHQDQDFTLLGGDVRGALAEIPDESVDCVVTSPPYWSLRDYQLPPSVWGGDPEHEHEWGPEIVEHLRGSSNQDFNERWGRAPGERKQETGPLDIGMGQFCSCGAWLGQLGLEPSPQLYVAHLVEVFRGVRRVLAPHGTVWLNIGDSYARDRKKGQHKPGDPGKQAYVYDSGGGRAATAANLDEIGLKAKDICMVPAELAIALRADGWWLRSEIVWSKDNPLPESVTDRPSRSHEMIYLLTKSHSYFFDQEPIREPVKEGNTGAVSVVEREGGTAFEANGKPRGSQRAYGEIKGANCRSVWTISTQSFSARSLGIEDDDHYAVFPEEVPRRAIEGGCPKEVCVKCGEPRRRLVERISVSRDELPASHPEYRPRRYEDGKAGDPRSPGSAQRYSIVRELGWSVCACALGLEPGDLDIIESPLSSRSEEDPSMVVGRAGLSRPRAEDEGTRAITRYEQRTYAALLRASPHRVEMEAEAGEAAFAHYVRTDRSGARPVPGDLLDAWIERGWVERVTLPEPGETSYRRGVVLDPFLGSGTTAAIAKRLGRRAIGIEMSEPSQRIALARYAVWWKTPTARPVKPAVDQLSFLDRTA